MTGFLVFVSALAVLSAAASQPIGGGNGGGHGGGYGGGLVAGVGGGDGTPYCNSIGCPGGYIPIDNAQSTECDDDPCKVSQCCQAFCSFHACPDGQVPIGDAQTTLCPDSGCTDDLCCE